VIVNLQTITVVYYYLKIRSALQSSAGNAVIPAIHCQLTNRWACCCQTARKPVSFLVSVTYANVLHTKFKLCGIVIIHRVTFIWIS